MQRFKNVLFFAVAYFAADVALNKFAFADGWTIIWPLNGITIALLVMRPRAAWLAVMIGVESGTFFGECVAGGFSPGVELLQRGCSAVEVLVSASLLPPFKTLEGWLRSPRIFQRFALALVAGPVISGMMAAPLFHAAFGQDYLLAFDGWATADALGIASTLPLALTLREPSMQALFGRNCLPRTLGVLAVVFTGAVLMFALDRCPITFLLYPLLLLVDSSLGFAGSAIAIPAVCLISVYCATHGLGPFGRWPADLPVPRNLALQVYFGFHVLALFPASLLFMERRRMAEELRETNARLTVLAASDGLTGLANRRTFDERYREEWERAQRLRLPLSLLMLDIDEFKRFNDLHGHVAGDRCLRAVANVLLDAVKRPEDIAARYGGEEFAVLLPNTDAAGARGVAEEVRGAVMALGIAHPGNGAQRVTVSVGVSTRVPLPSEPSAMLVQLADTALYNAKCHGRNRVEVLINPETALAIAEDFTVTGRNRVRRMLAGH